MSELDDGAASTSWLDVHVRRLAQRRGEAKAVEDASRAEARRRAEILDPYSRAFGRLRLDLLQALRLDGATSATATSRTFEVRNCRLVASLLPLPGDPNHVQAVFEVGDRRTLLTKEGANWSTTLSPEEATRSFVAHLVEAIDPSRGAELAEIQGTAERLREQEERERRERLSDPAYQGAVLQEIRDLIERLPGRLQKRDAA